MADKRTPFNDKHIEAGAKMVSFAGYQMPLLYSSIQAEHRAVRENVGLFDLSHMGEFVCQGPGALAFLQKMTVNDVAALAEYQVHYTAMCYPDGGIVDDLLIYRLPDHYLLVVNAANLDKDWKWLTKYKPDDVTLENQSDQIGMLAIQGPRAESVMRQVTDYPLDDVKFYWSAIGQFGSRRLLFSRTGYTGEDGFEIYCPEDFADELWNMVIAAGNPLDMQLVGLGARDSLRLEMRYALYGNELDANTNPIAAGLGWICKTDKGDFIGRDAIVRMKEEKPAERLVSLKLGPRVIPRQHYKVWADGREVGEIRSGLFSPSLGHGIATAYVPREYAKVGNQLEVEIRGKKEPATIVKPPFYVRPAVGAEV